MKLSERQGGSICRLKDYFIIITRISNKYGLSLCIEPRASRGRVDERVAAEPN